MLAAPKIRAFALSAVAGVIAFHPLRESDPFWHLFLGRAVLREGSRTVSEPSAFAAFSEPCVVPEWLWSIVTLGIHGIGGWALLTVFAAILAAASAWAIHRLASRSLPEAPWVAWVIAGLGTAAALARLRLRPQAMFMLLLPLFLERCLAFTRADDKKERVRIGVVLTGLTLLWAQLHGSFVLAPAIFGAACLIVPRDAWKAAGATLGGIVVASFTSAHGLDVVSYVVSHGGGEAKSLILDIQPAQWATFEPTASPFSLALVAVWLLAFLSLPRLGRRHLPHLAWTALGVLLVANAVRFTAAAAILALPLAVEGARTLLSSRRQAYVAGAIGVIAVISLGWAGVRTNAERGPLLSAGLRLEAHPVRAFAALRGLPEGTPVLTAVPAGGPLGFWSDGSLRTYVDSRTPLYFDDVDALVSQRVFSDPAAFGRALERYQVGAVVVRRNEAACGFLDGQWDAVALDGAFTTFLPPGRGTPLRGVQACGGEMVLPADCPLVDERAAAVARLREQAPGPLPEWIPVEASWICDSAADAAIGSAPPRSAMWWLEGRRDFLALDAAVERGDTDTADAIALSLVDDPRLFPHLDHVAASLSREALVALMHEMTDGRGEDRARINLAHLCVADEDPECARLHAVLSAVAGVPEAVPLLEWLETNHPNVRVRADAEAWRVTLTRNRNVPPDPR